MGDASPRRPLSIFGASRMKAAPYLHRDRLHESQVRQTQRWFEARQRAERGSGHGKRSEYKPR
jgi:hypothetical protein